MPVPVDVLIALDFEATCDDDDACIATGVESLVPRTKQEIIEFPFVALNTKTLEIEQKVQHYVKPKNTPITAFCTELTGITSDTTDCGVSLAVSVQALVDYVEQQIIGKGRTFCLVTHGSWDLWVQLRREAPEKNINLPNWMMRYYDLRKLYKQWKTETGSRFFGKTSLPAICDVMNIPMMGRLHSGLDDSMMITSILRKILEANVGFGAPADWYAELDTFCKVQGRTVRIFSLPFYLTREKLDDCISAAVGCAPESSRMHVFSESLQFAGDAFVTMPDHKSALALVQETHVALGGRPILFQPATSDQVLEFVTLPFPQETVACNTESEIQKSAAYLRLDNLFWHCTLDDIDKWCIQQSGGQCPACVLMCCSADGKSTGSCYVQFNAAVPAAHVVNNEDRELMCRRTVAVRFADSSEIELAAVLGILVGLRINKPWSKAVVCSVSELTNVDKVNEIGGVYGTITSSSSHILPSTMDLRMRFLVSFEQHSEKLKILKDGKNRSLGYIFKDAIRPPPSPDVSLFVGGLSRDTTDQSLRAAFSRLGKVSYAKVRRDEIQISRGFGFVAVDQATAQSLVGTQLVIDGQRAYVKSRIPR